MTSQQKIDLTLRAALIVKDASGMINCPNVWLIKEIIAIVETQLKTLRDKCDQYERENRK